jgi:hypothetical protein
VILANRAEYWPSALFMRDFSGLMHANKRRAMQQVGLSVCAKIILIAQTFP